MNKIIKIYRLLAFLAVTFLIVSCGGEEMQEGRGENMSEFEEDNMSASKSESLATEEATEVSSIIESNVDTEKWKNKAKQHLESIEDLALILEDPTLDVDFKAEIIKELNLLYDTSDSTMYSLEGKDLNFKNFKPLMIQNGDTMSLHFKNKKEFLKAEFVVVIEVKQFGESSEVIEQLKLISIKKDD